MKAPDVTIVGCGWVGASLALALSNSGRSVTLLDQKAPSRETSSDLRSIVISYPNMEYYASLGLLDLKAHASVVSEVRVSEKGKFGSCYFRAREYGIPALGYAVSASDLQASLLDALAKRSNVNCVWPAKVRHIDASETRQSLQLELENGEETLTSQLLVLADGVHSLGHTQLGLPVEVHDYKENAWVFPVQLTRPHHGISYERFCSLGTVASIPTSEQSATIILSTKNSELDEASLTLEAMQVLQPFLGPLEKMSTARPFPLKKTEVKRPIQPGVVLVGNAAHSLHPVAAQGLNLSLRDIKVLADIVRAHDHPTVPLGSLALLERYLGARRQDQNRTLTWTNALVNIFHSEEPLLKRFRSLGFLAMNLCPGLSKQVLRGAFGGAHDFVAL